MRRDAGRLRVNLLMNHASRWADVDSFLPYQGRVDVRPKRDADLDIRIPEWMAPGDAACTVNGVRRELRELHANSRHWVACHRVDELTLAGLHLSRT